jgi:two-component system LytT family response regulator
MFEFISVLIVDDEEIARLYLAEIIHELFPEIIILFAATPHEALITLNRQNVNLIFLDVEMPEMTGLELLSTLRNVQNTTPVIFISGYKRVEFVQKAMRLNAIDYIDKPVDPEELRNAILKCLNADIKRLKEHSPDNHSKYLLNTINGKMIFEPAEIAYFESRKRESIAHFVNEPLEVVIRENLKSLMEILPPEQFVRVSRQYIINKRYVKFLSQSNCSITLFFGGRKTILYRIYPDIFKSQIINVIN